MPEDEMRKSAALATFAGIGVLIVGSASSWAATPLSVRDSWRIGTSGTSFCSAQSLTVDSALTGMFDGGYSITCRDAVLPVGKLFKLRETADALARVAADRGKVASCEARRKEILRASVPSKSSSAG